MILARKTLEALAIGRKMEASQVLAGFAVEADEVKLNSINDLRLLSDRLILPMSQLLEAVDSDLDDGIKICRQDEGLIRSSERRGNRYYTYQHLATSKAAPELMALRVTVHCTSEQLVELNGGHGSSEIIYITKGPIRLHWQTGDTTRQVDLDDGDSVYLSPNVSHSFMALGGQDAELLAFNY